MLVQHGDDSAMQACMAEVVCRLAASDGMHAAIVAAGGVSALVAVFATPTPLFAKDSYASGAFVGLARSPCGAAAIAAAGGIPVLVTAVRLHADNVRRGAAELAAGALYRLAHNAENVASIAAAGGCTVVVSALANTAISAPAVVQCCLLLDTLAGVEAHGAAIVAAAALEAAIAAHTDDAVIVAAARSALSRLGR